MLISPDPYHRDCPKPGTGPYPEFETTLNYWRCAYFLTLASTILITLVLFFGLLPIVKAAPVSDNESVTTLKKLLGQNDVERKFLEPDAAFRLSILPTNEQQMRALFEIAEGYYLYRDKIRFETVSSQTKLEPYLLPTGETRQDEYFGQVETYKRDLSVVLSLTQYPGATVDVKVTYQGCAEKGICYPPIEKIIRVNFESAPISASKPEPAQALSQASLIGYLAAALGTGFLLSFTPCVLPLIPILSGVIVGQGATGTRLRAGYIASAYVLGTATTYAAAGAVAGATGEQLQAYFQNAWAIGLVSGVLVLMAFSMFGLYTLQLPAAMQSWLSIRSSRLGGGSMFMVFMLGAVSALIVGACVSPLLVSVLSVAILKADPLLGAALMFSMALGMGAILIALGFGTGAVLPQVGAWMERVKHAFGIALIAVAIYLLQAIPAVPVLLLWAVLFIVTGIYLGATDGLTRAASGWRYLAKGAGTVLLIWGVLAMIGSFSGQRDILQPISLKELVASRPSQNQLKGHGTFPFITVQSLDELKHHMALAKSRGRPLLLDYYADWCVDCVRMKKTTFRDPRVVEALAEFFCLQVDVTDASDVNGRALKQTYGVFGPPALLFFDRNGQEMTQRRLYGYLSAEAFLSQVNSI